jgi:predicted DNA-binding WGR domain protein
MDLGDWSIGASIVRSYDRIGLKGGSRPAEECADNHQEAENNASSS